VIARRGTQIITTLGNTGLSTTSPAITALSLYTQFSDLKKTVYTWNGSLPMSEQMFLNGNEAIYFGFASETQDLQKKNPNLNFGIATVPQSQTNQNRITYGNMIALAIPKMAKHAVAAFQVAEVLSSASGDKALADIVGIPPARRDLLNTKQTGAFKATFYTSAIWAHTFLQPDNKITEQIFRSMIDGVTNGSTTVVDAVSRASEALDNALKNYTM